MTFSARGRSFIRADPSPFLTTFLTGQPHIDVDNIGAGFFDDSRCLGHDLRIRTENLHGQGMFPVFDVQQFFRMLVAIADTLGTDHFRTDQGAHSGGR